VQASSVHGFLYRNAAAFLVQRLRRTTTELSIERDKNLHRP
jgi:hypothetical protein